MKKLFFWLLYSSFSTHYYHYTIFIVCAQEVIFAIFFEGSTMF